MARRSKVERLPIELQAEIGRLRERHTLDDILAHLKAMGGEAAAISRSGLARHISRVDQELAEDLRRSRGVAAYLAQSLDDAPGSAALRLNVELLHDQILSLMRRARDAAKVDGDGAAMDSQGLMQLARALESVSRAARTDLDYAAQAEKRAADRARGEAASAAAEMARAAGLSGETVDAIKARILGVAA